MTTNTFESTIQALLATGKGILAADESFPTIEKRFKELGIPDTEGNRRDYREMLFTTPSLAESISGVILFDETIRQATSKGVAMPELLAGLGMVPGIKVDAGTEPLPAFPGEKFTLGLDGTLYELDPSTGAVLGADHTGFTSDNGWTNGVSGAALLAYDGQLYVFGGASGGVSRYDVATKALYPIGAVNQMVVGASATPCLSAAAGSMVASDAGSNGGDDGGQDAMVAEERGRGHTQGAARRVGRSLELHLEGADVVEDAACAVEVERADVGQLHLPRRAVKEPHVEPLLEAAHELAHAGRRETELRRGLREGPLLDRREERSHAREGVAIGRHL